MTHYIHGGTYGGNEYETDGINYKVFIEHDDGKTGEVEVRWQEFEAEYFICYNCDEAFARNEYDRVVARDTANTFCESCADLALYWCDRCENYFEHDHCDHGYDDNLCFDCAEEEEDENCYLRGYHDSKDNGAYYFYRTEEEVAEDNNTGKSKWDRLYLGFEWEVDGRRPTRSTVDEIRDIFGNFFSPEQDGSVEAEFVSQPATLAYHVNQREKYETMSRALISDGCRSHDGGCCGLHVHASRSWFGVGKEEDYNIAKLLLLWERNYDNILKFSRRKPSQIHWCKRYEDKPVETVKKIKDWYLRDRYYDINLTNDNTVEFRMWRGTLNVNTLIATLKFTDRLCRLAKEHTAAEIYKMKWPEVLGRDPDITAYWEKRTGERFDNDGTDGEDE